MMGGQIGRSKNPRKRRSTRGSRPVCLVFRPLSEVRLGPGKDPGKEFVGQERPALVVLPLSVDAEIMTCDALEFEAGALKQAARGVIPVHHIGLHASEASAREKPVEHTLQSFRHIALAAVLSRQPIPERGALARPASDVGEGEPSDQLLTLSVKKEKREQIRPTESVLIEF